jgi:hypothetical protein
MPTVLRISGAYEQLRHSVLEIPFPFTESIASRKKRQRAESPNDGSATFNLMISDADGDCVPVQIEESSQFLSQNKDAIIGMRQLPGVEELCVDFSWDFPSTSIGQYNRFPCSFVKLCGILGIDIEVSVYAVSKHSAPEDSGRE